MGTPIGRGAQKAFPKKAFLGLNLRLPIKKTLAKRFGTKKPFAYLV